MPRGRRSSAISQSRSRSPTRKPASEEGAPTATSATGRSERQRVVCLSLGGDVYAEVWLEKPATVAQLRAAVKAAVETAPGCGLSFFEPGGGELTESTEVPEEVNVVLSARKLLATACTDGSAALWDAATGEWYTSFVGHELSVMSVALSPDGDCLATASSDYTLRLWSVPRLSWRLTLRGHQSAVLCVNFSADGSRLVSASSDRTARVWSAGSFGECLSVIRRHRKDVSWAAFSPDDAWMVTASDDRRAIIWDATSFRCQQTVECQNKPLNCVAWSPDSLHMAIASRGREIYVWKMQKTCGVQQNLINSSDVFAVCWNPADKTQLAAALGDKQVCVWDAFSGERVASLQGHSGKVFGVSYSADGRLLASASADETVKVWNAQTLGCLRTLEGHFSVVNAVSFAAPDKSC